MVARIAYQLGRGIEAHGLTVEQRSAERFGIMLFDPGGDIDQQGEACRMALGKAVFAEALDLAEAALGELLLVTVAEHAGDELLAEAMDGPDMAERCHSPSQAVGLAGGEACRDDGDLHGLLLEQRNAKGLVQHGL